MDFFSIIRALVISVGLGLLVGLQRERTDSKLAGFRTFPLITTFGTVCSLMGEHFGGWVVAAGLIALAATVVVGKMAEMKSGNLDSGLTTEVTILLMFGVGAYVVVGQAAVVVVITGIAAVLLHLKPQMHELAARIGDKDFKSIILFVLISLVILPILPDLGYGPYEAINPYRIWFLVVLIVGISLAGYVAHKFLGPRVGSVVGGLLGGLISSTATTAIYARRASATAVMTGLAAVVIMIASATVFLRVLVILVAIAPGTIPETGPPLATMMTVLGLISLGAWLRSRKEEALLPEPSNPTELKSALSVTVIFALIFLAVAAARENFGNQGLYIVAVLSGLTDMDAITLSTAQMIKDNALDPHTGWRLVLSAALSNLVFKTALVAWLGNRRLLAQVALLFALSCAAGVLTLAFWPG